LPINPEPITAKEISFIIKPPGIKKDKDVQNLKLLKFKTGCLSPGLYTFRGQAPRQKATDRDMD
jgi:hypothetical protein